MSDQNVVTAKSSRLLKPGVSDGGFPTYEIVCGKCGRKFEAQVPLHPDYQYADCPHSYCGARNML